MSNQWDWLMGDVVVFLEIPWGETGSVDVFFGGYLEVHPS